MKTFILPILLFSSVCLNGQKVPVDEIAPNVISGQTIASLTEELDAASETSPLYFHAKEVTLPDNVKTLSRQEDGYYFRVKATDLALRLFLNIQGFYTGDTLFVLNESGERSEFITAENLYQPEWSSRLYANEATLFYKSASGYPPRVEVLSYSVEIFKNLLQTEDFGDAGPCEVNVNCPEGKLFKDEKKSVARLLIRNGSEQSWCTGTLVSNTARNCDLLFITAEHCGLSRSNVFASSQDIGKWIFYFNYEGSGCSNPSSEAEVNYVQVTGADLLARSDDNGGDAGSDFILLKIRDFLPPSYTPYFAGWSRVNSAPQEGVAIHQPQGDVKKISTYTQPANNGSYTGAVPNTHWLVKWAPTANGHGVTDFGSSGSSLLDDKGLVTGILTGGSAKCTVLSGTDYFGKISYSWASNGTSKNRQLAPWLDPVGSGVLALSGAYCGDSIAQPTNEIVVYPTRLVPAENNEILIKGGKSTDLMEVHIYDATGHLKYKGEEFAPLPDVPQSIPIYHFKQGMYFVRVLINDKPNVTKIVIAN